MGKRKAQREYRDTFTFHLFPDYTYTMAQKKRFRLFQGRIEHYRAAINYADSFDEPNSINLLYLIGCNEKVRSYVEKTKSNLVVLCAEVPTEFLAAYDAYWKMVKRYQDIGFADQDGNFNSLYFSEREKEERHRGDGILSDDLYRRNDKEAEIIEAYRRISKESEHYFSRYRVIGKSIPERFVSHEDLDWIIKKIFPFGREQSGMSDRAYTSFAKFRDALQCGLARSDCSKIMGLPNGTDSFEVCAKGITRCGMNLNVELRRTGYADLGKIMERMKAPPYGWGLDAYSAYSLGYAVSGHLNGTWVWDSISCFQSSEIIQHILWDVVKGSIPRRRVYILLEEYGGALSERFAYLFNIGSDQYYPKDDTDREILALFQAGMSERKIAEEIGTMTNIAVHKRLDRMRRTEQKDVPFCNMAHLVCRKVEESTRWPISLVDERLTQALYGEVDPVTRQIYPIFGRQRVQEALSYFTWDKCKELRKRLDHINELVPKLIRQRCGADTDVDQIKTSCTTRSSGWIWSSETFWECVDRHIKNKADIYGKG